MFSFSWKSWSFYVFHLPRQNRCVGGSHRSFLRASLPYFAYLPACLPACLLISQSVRYSAALCLDRKGRTVCMLIRVYTCQLYIDMSSHTWDAHAYTCIMSLLTKNVTDMHAGAHNAHISHMRTQCMEELLSNASTYIKQSKQLPEKLPRRLPASEAETVPVDRLEYKGYCPVTFKQGPPKGEPIQAALKKPEDGQHHVVKVNLACAPMRACVWNIVVRENHSVDSFAARRWRHARCFEQNYLQQQWPLEFIKCHSHSRVKQPRLRALTLR